MLIDDKGHIWDIDEFALEAELEEAVFSNYQLIYGDQSLLFGKSTIRTESGIGTVPDAYVVDLENEEWFIVEVELLHHGVYKHIVPQITKQVNAASTPQMKTILRQKLLAQVQENEEYLQLFKDAEIPVIQISETIEKILCKPPKISIPIDKISDDLKTWAQSLKYEVRLQEIQRFKNRDTGASVLQIPDMELAQSLGGVKGNEPESDSLTGKELILRLIDSKLLSVGEVLTLTYKGKKYSANVTDNGRLELPDGSKKSPSLAAIYCVQKTKASRKTANGLKMWKNKSGDSLSDIRRELKNDDEEAA